MQAGFHSQVQLSAHSLELFDFFCFNTTPQPAATKTQKSRGVGEFEDEDEGEEGAPDKGKFKFKSSKCGVWVRHKPTECNLVRKGQEYDA